MQISRRFPPHYSRPRPPVAISCGPTRVTSRGSASNRPWLPTPFWCFATTHGISCWIATDPGSVRGAMLLQAYHEGKKQVAYASRSLLEHEKKWIPTALEAAGLVWALEAFRPYINGVHVTIRTDHAPSDYIGSRTDRCKRLERWALRVQGSRFSIPARPGRQQHVDALSRAPIPVESDQGRIVLENFPERVVLLLRSSHKRVAALPAHRGRRRQVGTPWRRAHTALPCIPPCGEGVRPTPRTPPPAKRRAARRARSTGRRVVQ